MSVQIPLPDVADEGAREILNKLVHFYELHDDIRVMALNGSRVNPSLANDKWKDFDVVFFTDAVPQYRHDPAFLTDFGAVLIETQPDSDDGLGEPMYPSGDGYSYLVQYTSGVRIDFQIMALSRLEEYVTADKLTMVLGDKDGRLTTALPEPSDADYWVTAPTAGLFKASVKEFWWQADNVLKENLRGRFLLSNQYLTYVRSELMRLLTWRSGFTVGFNHNFGKAGDENWPVMSPGEREALTASFVTSSQEQIMGAVRRLAVMEDSVSREVAPLCGVDVGQVEPFAQIPARFLRSKGEEHWADFFSAQ